MGMGLVKFIKNLMVIAGFIVPLAGLAEIKFDEPKQGEMKKAEVLDELKKQMDVAGLKFPIWLEKYTDLILGLVIDFVVLILNKFGFFDSAETLLAE